MVDPSPSNTIDYQWNTTGCYTNINYNNGVSRCFPNGQTTQNITGNDLNAEDGGTITCGIIIDGEVYTSDPITLRISGNNIPIMCANVNNILYIRYCSDWSSE